MDGGRATGALLGAVGVVVVVLSLIGSPVPAVVVLVVAGGAIAAARAIRRATPDASWSATSVPAAGAGPHHRAGVRQGSVARSLAAVEARMLALNPWFTAGIGFWLILIFVFAGVYAEDSEWSWWELFALLPALAHPMVGCTVVAVHRGVTRARRDGADELFDACPAPAADRTRAFLLTAWVPLVASWAFSAVLVALIAVRNPRVYGPVDGRLVVDVAIVGVLAIGATMLGTALGRWTPWLLAPIVVVVAIAAVDSSIAGLGPSPLSPERALVTWVYGVTPDPVFVTPPVWERLAWLGGLSAVVGGVALLHDERTRPVRAAVVGGAAVALLGAVSIARPLTGAEVDRVAGLIGHPADHQVCTSVTDDVEVCTYRPYRDYAGPIVAELRGVADALPPGWTDRRVTFRQRYDAPLEELPAAVRDRLPPTGRAPGAVPADLVAGTLHLGYSSHPDAAAAARFRLAAHAVGLPTEPRFPGRSVSGRSQGAVALWLATRGLTRDKVRSTLGVGPGESIGGRPPVPEVWPGVCHGEEMPVLWSTQDLAAARAIAEQPEDEVAATIAEGWETWTDPDTGTDELLEALGLHGLGRYDRLEPTDADRCQ